MAKYSLTYTETREVEHIPESCKECPFWEFGVCYKPMSQARGNDTKLRKPYLTKRHKDCPLTWSEL